MYVTYDYFSDDTDVTEEEEHEGNSEHCNDLLKVSVSTEDVRSGKFRLVYAHPEALLTAPTGRSILRSAVYRKNVCCIAIDEAHMIQEW